MKKIFISLFLFFCLHQVKLNAQELIDEFLVFYDGKMNIFPSDWLDSDTKLKAKKAKKKSFEKDSLGLDTALGYYPPSLLKAHLSKVYILGGLKFHGQSFTGTNSKKNIYIEGGNSEQTERTFHHEFSSILLRNLSNSSFKYKWKELSPSLIDVTSAVAVKAGYTGTSLNEALMEKGYLCKYSLSNWENDFNMYVEYLFYRSAEFWRLVDKYPKTKMKVDMVIEFYNKYVSHLYTEEFFREIVVK